MIEGHVVLLNNGLLKPGVEPEAWWAGLFPGADRLVSEGPGKPPGLWTGD